MITPPAGDSAGPDDAEPPGGSGRDQLAAEVLLRPASGRNPTGPVTSANVAELLADPDRAELARRRFEELGFDAGPSNGISFSIVGSRQLFERTFGAGIVADEAGVHLADGSYDLPQAALSRSLTRLLRGVGFTPPPSFDPTPGAATPDW